MWPVLHRWASRPPPPPYHSKFGLLLSLPSAGEEKEERRNERESLTKFAPRGGRQDKNRKRGDIELIQFANWCKRRGIRREGKREISYCAAFASFGFETGETVAGVWCQCCFRLSPPFLGLIAARVSPTASFCQLSGENLAPGKNLPCDEDDDDGFFWGVGSGISGGKRKNV